jgi:dihydropteroate synthase
LKQETFMRSVELAANVERDLSRIIPRREAGRRTRILAIVNLTPDSFHDGGLDSSLEGCAARMRRLVDEGADALDLGAESSRPHSRGITPREELERLLGPLERAVELGVPVSVDTVKAGVAREALRRGASIVNDISALSADPAMAEVCAEADAPVVLMHRRGSPQTMPNLTSYDDVVAETLDFLEERMEFAIRSGIAEEKIILDPGIGFAKTASQSFEIVRRLDEYTTRGRPVLLGASRKSFLAQPCGESTEGRLEGTLAVSALAVWAGVSILRVHDVSANVKVARTTEAALATRGSEGTREPLTREPLEELPDCASTSPGRRRAC